VGVEQTIAAIVETFMFSTNIFATVTNIKQLLIIRVIATGINNAISVTNTQSARK
jgi:hypothetical protein